LVPSQERKGKKKERQEGGVYIGPGHPREHWGRREGIPVKGRDETQAPTPPYLTEKNTIHYYKRPYEGKAQKQGELL